MTVTLVYPHQLFARHPAIKEGRRVYLIEDPLLFGTDARWPLAVHKQRLVLHRASMKEWASGRDDCVYVECPGEETAGTVPLLEEVLPKAVSAIAGMRSPGRSPARSARMNW